MKKLLFSIVLLFMAGQIMGQSAYETWLFLKKADSLNCRILYPENFDSTKKYPVLLFLHGAGERGDDNKKQLVHGSSIFLDQDFRKNYPAIIIFPQCPEDDYWSNVDVDRSTRPIGLKFNYEADPTPAMTLVLAMMDSLVALDYTLESQIYLGGLSMGGMGTYEFLARRPDMIAAAFAICGGGDPQSATLYGPETPVWVFHGAKDDVVSPNLSTAMVLALQKAGGEVRYNLYPEANHNSWDPAFSEEELIPWLFSHKKAALK